MYVCSYVDIEVAIGCSFLKEDEAMISLCTGPPESLGMEGKNSGM